jgi:hypothetical protein
MYKCAKLVHEEDAHIVEPILVPAIAGSRILRSYEDEATRCWMQLHRLRVEAN